MPTLEQATARKAIIDLPKFVTMIRAWQHERPPLYETDKNFQLLILFFLGELVEISEHRENEGLSNYDFRSETGETIDAGFFLACFSAVLESMDGSIDYDQALVSANGQANGSFALEKLAEVSGNIQLKSLEKDLQYLWTLWVSYLIHMKYPVSPTGVLENYTFPKNNGNYVRELLKGNPLFEQAFNRKMSREEKIAYFAHYRKAVRLIRDFVFKYVDTDVEHSGLKPKHYRPYKVFIYSFMNFSSVGLSPDKALHTLEAQLFKDYRIERTAQTPVILRPNHRLPN